MTGLLKNTPAQRTPSTRSTALRHVAGLLQAWVSRLRGLLRNTPAQRTPSTLATVLRHVPELLGARVSRLRGLLKRLVGADREKVIVVLAVTREEAAACVAHARTGDATLPIRVWCAAPGDPLVPCAAPGDPLVPCADYVGGATASVARRGVATVWPALTIVTWSGTRQATGLKLLPFLIPPFRILVRNEAGGYFSARPVALVDHASRRAKDALVSAAIRAGEWAVSTVELCRSWLSRFADWSLSILLAVLAWVAPLVWPLALAAMKQRGTTGHAVPVRLPLASDLSFVEVTVADRRWRRARILRAVESSSTFIVFRHPDNNAPAEPLLELAKRTGAFAVASQAAYTGWRKRIITRHPFRPLQEGECSWVLAPASPLLVIRRDALAMFGVPHALTFGAAMAGVFWRAAATGLEVIVVGGQPGLTQEPAMALEDLEFVARRHVVGPRTPALRRGNVATSGRTATFTGNPRILVVSPYLPFPLAHGGAVRIYNLCRELSAHIDFILVCFREANEHVHYAELEQVFREVYVVDIDEKQPDPAVPQQVHEYRNTAMDALIRRLCRERAVDLVQLEYTQMAEYRSAAGSLPVLLVEHDITFSLHRQLAQNSGLETARRQYFLWQQFERQALAAVGSVWAMSGEDRHLAIENGAVAATTAVVPNGVDLRRFQPQQKARIAPVVLFIGSFRHLPNLMAFEVLRQEIWPLVLAQVPGAKLHVIAGPGHERAARLAGKATLLAPAEGISMQGFVEDVRPAYAECDVVAIPLPISAGTNIKLMEAMACGRAVVSTPVGCVGLGLRDGRDILIRELGPSFAQALAQLLHDHAKRFEIAFQARKTAEQRFGWEAIAEGALASYMHILGRDPSGADTLVVSPLVPE